MKIPWARLVPAFLLRPAHWVKALLLKFEIFIPWKTLRISRAIRKAGAARRRPREEKEIVFIRDYPNPRETKISQCLRERGWRTVLLHMGKPAFDAHRFYDHLESYVDAWDALEVASKYSPTAFHVSCSWSFRTAEILVRHKPGKVVFDNTDQLAGFVRYDWLKTLRPRHLIQERFCLENADGLRCRDLSASYARRRLGYRFRGKCILFMDYGWGLQKSAPSASLADRGLSIGFCGGLAFEKKNPEQKYNHFLKLFKALTSRQIHVHIWPGFTYSMGGFEDTYSEYIDWARQCPYLHIHKTVPPDQMAHELSQYAFGLFVWGNPLHLGDDDLSSLPPRMDYSIGSRLFDYFDAGMVVICNRGRTPSWIVRHYGLGVVASDELYTSPREWLSRHLEGRTGREPARDLLTMPRQIHRLEAFYRSL